MDVIKAWFALISASGTTNNVSTWKKDYFWHSMLYLYFKTAKLVKLGMNYS